MNEFLTRLREQTGTIWSGMNRTARVGVLLGALLFLALLALLLWQYTGASSGYAVLYSNLLTDDAAEVVAALREQGVPYRLEQNGAQISVPAEQVPSLRLDLAAQGLPRGGVVGFEAFDTTRLGMTDFERQVQYQRALQGELTRTIRAFDQVEDARVHIALPERSLFVADRRDPSASVVLQLRPGTVLSASQVQAIVHLMARSIEGLSPEHVTVVDTRGNVLTDMLLDKDALRSDVVARQLEVQRAYEMRLSQDVQSLLEQVYGAGNVVARVNVELNFDKLEEVSEVYTSPTGGSKGIARSEQRTEERYEGEMVQPGGVPGVDSNIPGYVTDSGSQAGTYELLDETINYELNRTVTNRDVAPGAVRRLSVAVIIDGNLDAAQQASIRDAVAAVVGVDPDRGDVISVQSMQFGGAVPADVSPVMPTREMTFTVPYLVVALLLLLGGSLVVWMRRRRAKQAAVVDIVVDEAVEPEEELPLSAYEQKKRQVRARVQTIAKERPKDVAELLRAWMAEDR